MAHIVDQELDAFGVDKVTRYKWSSKNAPGEMRMVGKQLLYVDHSYQRDPKNMQKVLKIAREWNWVSLGAIVVARRKDGTLYVIDGQHRVLAAIKRSDVQELPCLIFDIDEIKDEAKAFIECNTGRKPVQAIEKHKAAVMSGDGIAQIVERLISEGGKKITAGGNPADGIKCIGLMNKLAAKEYDSLVSVWPLICKITKGQYVHERLIDGLVYIEKRMPEGESLTDKRWAERLISIGNDDLLKAANDGAVFFSKGGNKAWATGMVNRINKGLKKPLEIV